MKKTQLIQLLSYLLRPEDTSIQNGVQLLQFHSSANGSIAWTGVLKALFWTTLAIVIPILVISLLK